MLHILHDLRIGPIQ